jgi:predicted Zn-dependent protease
LALASGCATNPVTGKRMFTLVGEQTEIQQDREAAPHQFSADYGPVQDAELNAYIDRVGRGVAAVSHRPNMPYSFRAVNAVYVNAYTFPGGSVAITRGMLLEIDNEAELAAVLGHETGHVNARHTAQAMSWGMVAQLAVAGATAYAGRKGENAAALAAGLGSLGSGALLARYSRDNEREADALGLEYMVRAGHNPQGMVDLMELLRGLSKHNPGAVEMLFATHPMSEERYATATAKVDRLDPATRGLPANRDAYQDRTRKLRAIKPAIVAMQNGETALAAGKLDEAAGQFGRALQAAPDDYAGLLLMAKCRLAGKKADEARRYAVAAQKVYPQEAQAWHVGGMAALAQKQFEAAYESFARYERILPGNVNTTFFKGYSLEGAGRRDDAAGCYASFLRSGAQGSYADHARTRLTEWGYLRPAPR